MLQGISGWTININSGTTYTSITGSWSDTSWYAVLGAILNDQDLCMTANFSTGVITISNC